MSVQYPAYACESQATGDGDDGYVSAGGAPSSSLTSEIPWGRCLILHLAVWRFQKAVPASSARGIAWLLLPREKSSKLIFSLRRVDPMWGFADVSNRRRRHIQARVQRTQFR